MARKWTPAQSLAIDTRDRTLLVCAAAGSGKTAALTERIIRSLTDKDSPADIKNMLVVTFTRAAASELRQRIYTALADSLSNDPENKHLSEQIINISSAKICTIDAFYLDVIRQNFDKLDISPSFRTADAAELDVLARSVMEDTVDAFYETRGKEFSAIAECFVNMRNSAALSDVFLDLYSSLESIPDGIDFIKSTAERTNKEALLDFFESSYGKILTKKLSDTVDYHLNVYNEMCDEIAEDELISPAYLATFAYEKGFLESFRALLENPKYKDLYEHVRSYNSNRLSSPKKGHDKEKTAIYKSARDSFKSDISGYSSSIFGIAPQNIPKAMKKTADILFSIYDLLNDFEMRFSSEKKQKNICSFSDVRRNAMNLLIDENGDPTQTALEYSEKFSHVYIDEYQDVDRVQDMIFRAVSKPRARFMVGDIKQSIYSFRGAEPEVFAAYRKEFPAAEPQNLPDSDALSIFMSNNFRCDSTVVDFTNAVCSYVFSECVESMGYSRDDDLVFSKIVENRLTDEVKVEVNVIVPPEDEPESDDETDDASDSETASMSSKELEAAYIASKICDLLQNGTKADGTRIQKQDIAVLFRTNAMGTHIKNALNEAGIACSDNTDEHYFEDPDVLLMLCLLNAIDNPQRDIYLAGLLRSPFFDFSLDELIAIRRTYSPSLSLYDALCQYANDLPESELGKKCLRFNELLLSYRDTATSLTVDKLLRYLYDSELMAASGLVNADDNNNLQRLYEYARNFEGSSFKGLYNFIVYLNRIIEQNTKISSSPASSDEGKVTLMNIHQSKGLEFPVCFVCNTGALFDSKESRESMVFHPSCGLAMKIADGSGYARVNTPMRQAILCVENEKQAEEEMRILYVALTRARERLFVTGTSKSCADKLISKAEKARRYKCRYTVCSARSYLDWILAAVCDGNEYSFCKTEFIEKNSIKKAHLLETDSDVGAAKRFLSALSEDERKLISERFAFVYPYGEATTLPAKISVSELLPKSPDQADLLEVTELFIDEKDAKTGYSPPSILTGGADEKDISPTKRGTATHLFLQFCDFDKAKQGGIAQELLRLIEKRFIPADSKELVFAKELERFLSSDLYRLIKKGKRVIREQRFNIMMEASALNSDPEFIRQTKGEFLAVQGVIDLIIEDNDGNIILCDYKTDRLSKDELFDEALMRQTMVQRHSKQLSFYREAIKQLFGKECKEVFIYSTHASKLISIPTYEI